MDERYDEARQIAKEMQAITGHAIERVECLPSGQILIRFAAEGTGYTVLIPPHVDIKVSVE